MRFLKLKEVNSTNDYAKNINEKSNWDVISAITQSGGRGRNGKIWVSLEGGAWFSIIIKVDEKIKPENYSKISLIAGAAVRKILSSYGADCFIKWPNDIYCQNKKLCGILVEKSGDFFIAGIGININIDNFDGEAKNGISLYQVTGQKVDIYDIIEKCSFNVKKYYEIFVEGGWEKIYSEIASYDMLKDKKIKLKSETEIIDVYSTGIDSSGMLNVILNGKEEKIFSGEVSVII